MKLDENLNINIIKDGKLKIIYDFYKTDLAKKIKTTPTQKNHWQNIKTNSVTLGVNVLLIQKANQNILIDTGIGTRSNYSDLKKYKIEQPRTLLSNLKSDYNLSPGDIDYVILTHLHFDHTGGSVKQKEKETNELVPTFPKAKYFVSKEEFDYAIEKSKEEDNTSFFKENFTPLLKENKLEIIEYKNLEKKKIFNLSKNISIHLAGGHTKGFQYVKISSSSSNDKQTIYFVGDIIPTPWHVNNRTFPGVDHDEEQLLKVKQELLEEISNNEEGIIIFQHSPSFTMGKIIRTKENKIFRIQRVKQI